MKAIEAIHRAKEAGLTLETVPEGLKVRGPRQARVALLPMLRPLTDEIRALLARQSPCVSGPDACPACGYIHGAFDRRPPCNGCGGADWTVTVAADDGNRYCRRCL